jgi:pimeloyl-ACP methyl ester carboxylesterase
MIFRNDFDKKVQCPLLVLWGSQGFVHRTYDVLRVRRDRAEQVEGRALNCGHFLPEEYSAAVCEELFASLLHLMLFTLVFTRQPQNSNTRFSFCSFWLR